MSYHNRIMNLPVPADSKDWDDGSFERAVLNSAYAMGHRDARHAAVEIAAEADQFRAAVKRGLEELREQVGQLRRGAAEFGSENYGRNKGVGLAVVAIDATIAKLFGEETESPIPLCTCPGPERSAEDCPSCSENYWEAL